MEEGVFAGGDFPVIRGDVDEAAVGGGQVEEDFAGDGTCAAGADAMPDGEALVILGLLGLSFEVAEDGVEGLGGGDGIELIEALVEEPVAEGGGADREDEEAVGRGFGEALCRLSNGLGASLRETAGPEPDPPLRSYRRPVLCTATPRWSPPPELTNRALIVSLPEIPPAKCRPELELLNTLLQAFPAILGALCSAVSTALRRLPALTLPSSRLPDAFAWILAASPALVCPGEEPFTEDEIRASFTAHLPRTVDHAVRALMDRQPEWSGTASELCDLLQPLTTNSPRGLSQHLHAAAPSLAAAGIEIVFRHSNGLRIIDLSRKDRAANSPEAPSEPSENPQPNEPEELLAA